MTFHHGWLMIGEGNGNYAELFNHARTAAYLTNSTVLGCGTVHNVLDDGGCAGYPWMPGVDPAELLREAVLWLDAEHSEVGEQAAVNYGSGGAALNARYGSTAGSDTNDPLLLTHTGENYVYLPGSSGNGLSFTSALGGLVGASSSIEIETLTNGSTRPGVTSYVISNLTSASGGGGWALILSTVGTLSLGTHDGVGFVTAASTVVLPSSGVLGLKANLSAGSVNFYYTTDEVNWTQLGATVAFASVSGPGGYTTAWIGSNNNTAQFYAGSMKRMIVRDGPDGTTLLDFNAATDITDAGATSFTATSGQTVTVNRATSGRKTALVTRPIWLFGTDDYLEVADNALLDFGAADDFTVAVVLRPWATQAANSRFVDKRQSGDLAGYGISATAATTAGAVVDAGVAEVTRSITFTPGALSSLGLIIDRTAQTAAGFINNTVDGTASVAAVGSLASTAPLRVGALGSGANYGDFECAAVAVWRRVLTADEIAVITAYYSQEAYDDRVVGIPAFAQATFSTPSGDEAPWYNSSYPESGEALGFWITEWTGLDSGHIQREVTQVGAYRGGGVMGALGSRSRDMGFEVILLGESEKALDYLFRWLDATLSSVCATCATDTILLRRYCPDAIDPADPDTITDGVVEMRGVGLISGLQWGAPPVEQAGCFIRRANFTLGATDPCMYGLCTDVPISQSMVWADCWAAAALSESRVECRPNCSEMDPTCRATFNFTVDAPSGMSPILRFVAPTDTVGSVPFRVRTYANPNGLLAGELCGAPLLAELYIAEMPPYSELTYDMATREVLFSNAATGAPINGFAYILPNTVGVPRFATLGCGDYTVVVEPADFCYPSAPNVIRKYSEVSMVIRERMGCA